MLTLLALDLQAKDIQKAMQEVSSHFKPLIDDGADILTNPDRIIYPEGQSPQDAMKYPYRLCGVATRRDVVYLLHPDIKSNIMNAKQWWRMQYDTESSNPLIRRDTQTLQEVLERATSESASVLLVYANEAAMSAVPASLSKPLEEFVKKDKLAFLEELQKNATSWDSYEDEYSNVAQGGWDKDSIDPSDFDSSHDWKDISAQRYHQNQNSTTHLENMSSATLTPNTEMEGMDEEAQRGPHMQEMIEVNGGMDAMMGLSSETLPTESMEIDDDIHMHDKVEKSESQPLERMDGIVTESPLVEHVEVLSVEKKGS